MRFKYYLRGAGIGVIAATLILSVAFLFHDNISDEEVIRRAMKLGMVMKENTPGTLADPPQSGASSVDLETGADAEGSTKADADPLADSNGADEPSGADTDGPSGADNGQPSDPASGADNGQPSDPASGADTGQPSSDPDSGPGTGQPSDTEPGKDADQPSGDKKGANAEKPSGSKAEEQQADSKADHKAEDDKPEKSDEVEIVIASGDVSRKVSAKVFEAGLVDDADEFNSYLGSHDYDNMLQPGTYKIKRGQAFSRLQRFLPGNRLGYYLWVRNAQNEKVMVPVYF